MKPPGEASASEIDQDTSLEFAQADNEPHGNEKLPSRGNRAGIPSVFLEVQNVAEGAGSPSAETIERWVLTAVAASTAGEMVVRIVDEAESQALNSHYRGRQSPTNVLAFPAELDGLKLGDEPQPIGDLVVCAPVVEREAAEQNKTTQEHWAHIVIHGVLHLLGYDHEIEADAELMEARERELLARLGFDDPYRGESL